MNSSLKTSYSYKRPVQCVMPLHSFLSMSNWVIGVGLATYISTILAPLSPLFYLFVVNYYILSLSAFTVSLSDEMAFVTPFSLLRFDFTSWNRTKFLSMSWFETLFYIVCISIMRN